MDQKEVLRHFKRQALHAFALGFIHPSTNEPVNFKIDAPEDMQALILALRKDTEQRST